MKKSTKRITMPVAAVAALPTSAKPPFLNQSATAVMAPSQSVINSLEAHFSSTGYCTIRSASHFWHPAQKPGSWAPMLAMVRPSWGRMSSSTSASTPSTASRVRARAAARRIFTIFLGSIFSMARMGTFRMKARLPPTTKGDIRPHTLFRITPTRSRFCSPQ